MFWIKLIEVFGITSLVILVLAKLIARIWFWEKLRYLNRLMPEETATKMKGQ